MRMYYDVNQLAYDVIGIVMLLIVHNKKKV